ncbi:MAG: threonine synthase [Clostridia bacterium]|nr:threonine synthase [Clostridia bacterium]
MQYFSTRNQNHKQYPSEAILRGIAEDGGLYIPERFENFPMENLPKMTPKKISETVLSLLFGKDDMFREEGSLEAAISRAYEGKFDGEDYAPLAKVGNAYVMELYHGPTAAFKDVALQLLPQLLAQARTAREIDDEIVILTATSGDTGSAALHGFSDVPNTRIIVFYPKHGTSAVQERQMISCKGKNTCVVAVNGNFDDAQNGVKAIFKEAELPENVRLSSANSINIGRLAPQVAYYFKAYRDLLLADEICMGERVNFVVPTGNFGDILAGYFAMRMGLPVGRLLCASNRNNVLSDFFENGIYDRNRDFHVTNSPSMDILISSNLERLIAMICGTDACSKYMNDLKETGRYQLTADELSEIRKVFGAGFADDTETLRTIRAVYETERYLMDTHTAVAWNVYEQWKPMLTGKTVVLSTASAYKFSSSVLDAMGILYENEFDAIKKLKAKTGVTIPGGLADILEKEIVHQNVIEKNEMLTFVEDHIRGGDNK